MLDANALRRRFLESGADDDLPIADAHQHFFDIERNYYPWLADKPVKHFRYGNYDAIRRTFLPGDYFRAAGHHKIVKTVLIEGNGTRPIRSVNCAGSNRCGASRAFRTR